MTETIPDALAGERVDRVVALLTGLTRREVAELIASGAVRVGGTAVPTRSRRVAVGDLLVVDLPAQPEPRAPVAEPDVTVSVVFADDAVVVVDKPAGLVVHPGAGHPRGTLIGGLVARFPDLAALAEPGAEVRPGIVHRLDKGTSGLVVVARSAAARKSLVGQLAARQAERHYAALVWGRVDADGGMIDAPIRRGETDPTRMAVRVGGREARTRYRVEQRFGRPVETTRVECRLDTGRTHQIRVHLAAIGHPILGDHRYGRAQRWPAGMPALPSDRVWLHAKHLAFNHPVTDERVSFDSPLPTDLEAVLAALS